MTETDKAIGPTGGNSTDSHQPGRPVPPDQQHNAAGEPGAESINWKQIDQSMTDARPTIAAALALLRRIACDPAGMDAAIVKLDPMTAVRVVAAWAALGTYATGLLADLESIDAIMAADRRRRRRSKRAKGPQPDHAGDHGARGQVAERRPAEPLTARKGQETPESPKPAGAV